MLPFFEFAGGFRLAYARVPIFTRVATPGVAASLTLDSKVLAFVSVDSEGSKGGVLFTLFGWLVHEFRTCELKRDVSKHTQHVRARIANQAKDFLGYLR